jgi:hypothetical protein
MQDFGGFSSIVSAVERVPKTSMVVTATIDGSVSAWSLDTIEAKFKMRVQNGVVGLHFTSNTSFFFFNGREVHVMMLRHFFTTFTECSSMPTALELVAPRVIMATCTVCFKFDCHSLKWRCCTLFYATANDDFVTCQHLALCTRDLYPSSESTCRACGQLLLHTQCNTLPYAGNWRRTSCCFISTGPRR